MYTIEVNGFTFDCIQVFGDIVFRIPETASFNDIKTAFDTNNGDILVKLDGEVIQVIENYDVLQSIVYTNNEYEVTVTQNYDETAVVEILVGDIPTVKQARKLRESIESMSSLVSDDDAEKEIWAFPDWAYPKEYKVGDRVKFNSILYKCITAHTSQSDWRPDVAASLWTRIGDPGDEWPEWIQPTGAFNAYSAGAKVSHNEKHWISDVDYNVWEPGVINWTEQAEPGPEPEEWPEWVQPTGAQDAYPINAQVSHHEKHWINTMDANVYEPGVYGWNDVTPEE